MVFWESFGSNPYLTHARYGVPLLSFKSNLLITIYTKELFIILMLLLKLPSSDTLVSNTTAKKKFGKPNERAFPALASARAC
jgi:hypothetical protein